MGAELDRLEIQVEAQATKANNQLDKLVAKLDRVSGALSNLNGGGLTGLSNGVAKFAQASTQLSNVKTTDFTRLTKNIQSLSNLNTQQIYGAASSMRTLSNAINSLGSVSASSLQVAQVASDISKLGGANVQKAIVNLPALATAMNNFMSTLSRAPQVSQNVIAMTNAMAKLVSQSAKVGSTGNTLTTSVNRIGTSMEKTTKKARSFSSILGSIYQKYFWVMRAGTKLWDSVKSSIDYVEVLNYFDAAFGQVADSAVSQWENAGADSAQAYYNSFSERAKQLTTKMTGFTITDSGMLESTGGKSLGINPSTLMNYQAMFAQMSNSMGVTAETSLKLSTALTEIGADLASVKNMDFEKVWTDMASGLVGMSRTLDKYGANIRNVNLQQKLTELGINANITALNQNEKALLRSIILLDSTRYAWGDLAETINQPANQLRLLQANFGNLARTIGNIFLPIVAKVLPYINALVIALQRLAEWIVKLLGFEDFDWGGSSGTGGTGFDDLLGSIGDTEEGLNDATGAAKKLKTQLLGIDELNVLNQDDDSSGSVLGGLGGYGGLLDGALDSILDEYQKAWDKAFANMEERYNQFADNVANAYKEKGLFGVGEYIGEELTKALNSIQWETVYEGARGFGTGLADFLNGLISPELFGAVGQTIAGVLNTKLNVLNSFGETFDWSDFGTSLGNGLDKFFETWDAGLTVETFNSFGKGFLKSFSSFFKTLKNERTFKDMGQKLVDFIIGIDWGGLTWDLSEFFTELSTALVEFPVDFGIGIAEAIWEEISGQDVTLEMPKWLEGLGDIMLGWISPQLGAFNLANTIQESLFGSGEHQALGGSTFGGDSSQRSDGTTKFAEELQKEKESFNLFFEDIGTSATTFFDDVYANKLQEFVTNSSTKFSEWYTNSVSPWFTEEKWSELYQVMVTSLETKWGELQTWWSETALAKWWTSDVKPWFSSEKWNELYSPIKSSLETKWDEMVDWWTTSAIYRWYNDNVKTWFSKEKWNFAGIKDGLVTAWENAIAGVKAVWNKFANWFNSKMTIELPSIEIAGERIFDGKSIEFIKLPTFQTGGFPEDGLFMANHSELVGKFSNGRTAVANNEMIVAGIEEAAYRGFTRAYAEYDREASLLEELIVAVREGRDIQIDGRSLVEAYDARKARNGYAF